jgi:hypothetical protein
MLLGGKTVFPITLSGGPPLGNEPATALDGWNEVAQAGVTMLRIYPKWKAAAATELIKAVKDQLAAAEKCGLRLWVGLFDVANNLAKQALLEQVVDGLKDSPGLGAWKGADEPLWAGLGHEGLTAAYEFVRSRDPNHPLVIIQAPKGPKTAQAPNGRQLTAALLKPFTPAGDIHGVDIYPISHPPGKHSDRPNTDISVVGDVTELVVQAAHDKEHWTTLQIAWSGMLPPENVPIFPSLRQERFMAYQAIIAGARGLVFFGGDLPKAMNPEDKAKGWNWTFWTTVLKPLLRELTSKSVGPALVAPPAAIAVKASAADVKFVTRRAGGFLYLITVRRSPTANGPVRFSGLPSGIKFGAAMFEYDGKDFRTFVVKGGAFTDPFAPHGARVYRFKLQS